MQNAKKEQDEKPTPRLAVLETADHADEVKAMAGGQDRMEYTYPTPASGVGQPSAAFNRKGFGAGHHWEKLRPLEATNAAVPVIAYSENWRHQRGRFGAIKGFGQVGVHVLLARRPY